jgi:lipid A 4'-phosphatase
VTEQRWSSAAMLKFWLAATLAVVAIFAVFPNLDLFVADMLYLGQNDFLLRSTTVAHYFDDYVRYGERYGLIALVLWYLVRRFTASAEGRRRAAACGFFLVSFAVATGLIVHLGLKENWGQARPKQIVQFDGEKQYTPPFQPAAQCDRNCSFVSGDASTGFAVLALALYARRRQRFWVVFSIGFGLAVGAFRMSCGAHFLSDVLVSGVITDGTILVLYRWFVEQKYRHDIKALRHLLRSPGTSATPTVAHANAISEEMHHRKKLQSATDGG